MSDDVASVTSSGLIEVRSTEGQGRGYFAKAGVVIGAGTPVLEGCRPIVWAVNDEHESRNCRLSEVDSMIVL